MIEVLKLNERDELISVIVPVYNVKNYLDRCLLSIMNQSYKNLEIIIIDDGSTDESGKVCDQYAKKDKRIKVFHKDNEGLSSARNYGLDVAIGDYIGFIDSDDYVEEDMYELLLASMEEKTDLVCCGTIYKFHDRSNISKKGYGKAPKKTVFSNNEAMEELMLQRYISFSACDKLYRKELFNDLRFPVGRTSEDLPVVYKIIKRCRCIVNIGRAKYIYCYRNNSISRREFYFRRVDYSIFAGEICKDISENYPQFRAQAEALYIQYVIFTLKRIGECKKRDHYKYIERRFIKVICRMSFNILFNQFISIEDKKRYFIVVMNSVVWNSNLGFRGL